MAGRKNSGRYGTTKGSEKAAYYREYRRQHPSETKVYRLRAAARLLEENGYEVKQAASHEGDESDV